jgi:hypothetical protein
MVEWSMLALVIVLLLGVFAYKVREVHAQAELASVRLTLGNLRTALVLDHLRRSVPSGAGAAVQSNPFKLLQLPTILAKPAPRKRWRHRRAAGCLTRPASVSATCRSTPSGCKAPRVT